MKAYQELFRSIVLIHITISITCSPVDYNSILTNNNNNKDINNHADNELETTKFNTFNSEGDAYNQKLSEKDQTLLDTIADSTIKYVKNDQNPAFVKLAGVKDADADVDKEFRPVPMPKDFDSYDILPMDGYVSLQELVQVTGAEENVDQALKDSDLDGDGRLSRDEFDKGMFSLGANTNTTET